MLALCNCVGTWVTCTCGGYFPRARGIFLCLRAYAGAPRLPDTDTGTRANVLQVPIGHPHPAPSVVLALRGLGSHHCGRECGQAGSEVRRLLSHAARQTRLPCVQRAGCVHTGKDLNTGVPQTSTRRSCPVAGDLDCTCQPRWPACCSWPCVSEGCGGSVHVFGPQGAGLLQAEAAFPSQPLVARTTICNIGRQPPPCPTPQFPQPQCTSCWASSGSHRSTAWG